MRMSPELLRWFTAKPAKRGTSRTLPFEELDGEYFYSRSQLLAFDEYLCEPWPHSPGRRPPIPTGIRTEIKMEALAKCALCNHSSRCEVAHIDAVAKTHNNHPHNLIFLCPNHHSEYDLGFRAAPAVDRVLVERAKRTLLEAKTRIWRLEHRASHELLSLIQLFTEYKEALAIGAQTPAQAFETRLQVVSESIKRVASSVRDSEPQSYRELATDSLRAIQKRESFQQRADSLARARDEYLAQRGEVICPLCTGQGFFRNYDDCPICLGSGALDKRIADEVELSEFDLVKCRLCKGKGQWRQYDECPLCHGAGELERGILEQADLSEFELQQCRLCRGAGHFRQYDECPVCGGLGRIESRLADEVELSDFELVDCPVCRGEGCRRCDDSGKVERRIANEYEADEDSLGENA